MEYDVQRAEKATLKTCHVDTDWSCPPEAAESARRMRGERFEDHTHVALRRSENQKEGGKKIAERAKLNKAQRRAVVVVQVCYNCDASALRTKNDAAKTMMM